MDLRFKQVTKTAHIEKLAALADEIWHEYWPERIGSAQTDYMVEQFQSIQAITKDITENNYYYYLVYAEDKTLVGYTGACPENFESSQDTNANEHGEKISELYLKRLFISKIYLLKNERGKHYSSKIIEFWNDFSKKNKLQGMYLTVNKNNELGIRAYLARGFETIESLEADIGEGFVMDDYIMACKVK